MKITTRIKLAKHTFSHRKDVAWYRISIYKYAKVYRCSFDHFTLTETK